jgi:hypothetical protein
MASADAEKLMNLNKHLAHKIPTIPGMAVALYPGWMRIFSALVCFLFAIPAYARVSTSTHPVDVNQAYDLGMYNSGLPQAQNYYGSYPMAVSNYGYADPYYAGYGYGSYSQGYGGYGSTVDPNRRDPRSVGAGLSLGGIVNLFVGHEGSFKDRLFNLASGAFLDPVLKGFHFEKDANGQYHFTRLAGLDDETRLAMNQRAQNWRMRMGGSVLPNWCAPYRTANPQNYNLQQLFQRF